MPADSRSRYFASQRAIWVTILIWAMIVLVLVVPPIGGTTPLGTIANVLMRLVLAGGLAWILYGTGYKVTDQNLVLRSGPLFFRIGLERIEGVAPCSHWMWSGIAWGLGTDTLKLDFRGRSRFARITPADKQGFLLALAERCPQLEFRGDRLVPAGSS